MTPGLEWLLIAWGIVTGIFLILLFYRSTPSVNTQKRPYMNT
jgi:hypothetical protein